jgi:hypothetical protein
VTHGYFPKDGRLKTFFSAGYINEPVILLLGQAMSIVLSMGNAGFLSKKHLNSLPNHGKYANIRRFIAASIISIGET